MESEKREILLQGRFLCDDVEHTVKICDGCVELERPGEDDTNSEWVEKQLWIEAWAWSVSWSNQENKILHEETARGASSLAVST